MQAALRWNRMAKCLNRAGANVYTERHPFGRIHTMDRNAFQLKGGSIPTCFLAKIN
jgi:hypothetical protein